MNFVFQPYNDRVSEWDECYYDHVRLSGMLHHLETTIALLASIKNSPLASTVHQSQSMLLPHVSLEQHSSTRPSESSKVAKYEKALTEIIYQQYGLFARYARHEEKIVAMFVQYKVFQLEEKLVSHVRLIDKLKYQSREMMLLLENLVIESYYLKNAILTNTDAKARAWALFNSIEFPQWLPLLRETKNNHTFHRMAKNSQLLQEKIECTYVSYAYFNNKHELLYEYLQKEYYKEKKTKMYESLQIGLATGGLVAFIVIIVVLTIKDDNGLGTNTIFTDHFPTWRGASEVIFYFWVLGLCVLFFEQANISYKQVFYFEGFNLPHSKFFFMTASIFSLIYLVFLLVFLLETFNTLSSNVIYYGQIFWLLLIVFIFNPLPIFHHQGRYQALKMLGKVILSPCFPMNFLMIWITEQLISLTQPLSDFCYTVYIFASRDAALTRKAIPNFNSAIVITVFSYRMFQNLKFWHQLSQAKPDKNYDPWAPPFLGFCRALFGFFTAITAMVYRLQLFARAFEMWLVISICSTLVAWYVDVKGDWGLFNIENHTIFRPRLLFSKKFYYFFLAFNMLLRVSWALTISPFVINSTGVWPVLFVMLISFIEIFRRGVWNVLRIENEHMRNCEQYQATVRDKNILDKAEKKAKQISEPIGSSRQIGSSMTIITKYFNEQWPRASNRAEFAELAKRRTSEQLSNLKQYLSQRKQMRTLTKERSKANSLVINSIVREMSLVHFFKGPHSHL